MDSTPTPSAPGTNPNNPDASPMTPMPLGHDAGHGPRRSLVLKFGLVLTISLLATILTLGWATVSRLQTELLEDLKRQGAMGVAALAAIGQEYVETMEAKEPFFDEIRNFPNELRDILPSQERLSRNAVSAAERAIKTLFEKRLKHAQDKQDWSALSSLLDFSGSLPKDEAVILDAAITYNRYRDELLLFGAKGVGFKFRTLQQPEALFLVTPSGTYEIRDVAVEKGESYQSEAGPFTEAYKFSKPLHDRKGKWVGNAHLTISTLRMGQIASRMNWFLFCAGAIALVGGIGISVVLAALVNRPLKQLLQDINIVAQGRLDHRALVRTQDEVGLLARTFNQMTQSLKMAHEAEIENAAIRRDLKIAQEVQAHLVPQEMPKLPGLDLTARYEPAREVGGDAFDVIPLGPDRLAVVIADVSGKGVPGALYMAMTRVAFRVATRDENSAAEVVKSVHQLISPELSHGRFITAAYLDLDVKASRIVCCRLGHNPILHFSKNKKEIREYTPRGHAIGIVNPEIFSQKLEVLEFDVQPGDRVLLFTDGITEAQDSDMVEFGEERLKLFMQDHSQLTSEQFVDALIREVKIFTRGRPLQDDLSVVSIMFPVASSGGIRASIGQEAKAAT